MDETLVEQIGVANRPSMNAHFAFGRFFIALQPLAKGAISVARRHDV